MNKNYILFLSMLIAVCIPNIAKAQQGFGTSNPAVSSVIDMVASNKGALFPRVALTSTTVAAPIPSPVNALTVFNTATAGDVTPGYYYWSTADSKWIRLANATDVWKLLGNASTTSGTNAIGAAADGNYLGTTDAQNLVLATGGIKRLIIDNAANAYGGSNGSTVATATSSGGNNRNFVWGNNSKLVDPGNLGNANSNAIFGATNTVNAGGASFGSTNIVAGGGNNASTSASAVFGSTNTASGLYNIIAGRNNTLNASSSTVFGEGNTVTGYIAAAIGQGLKPASMYEFNAGRFNAITTGTDVANSPTQWLTADALFQIGNGTDDATRANALTILKNGNIGTDIAIAPTAKLDIGSGNVRIRDINSNAGAATDKMVVADTNGVLKTVTAFTLNAIRTEVANYSAVTTDETILVDASAGAVIVTLPTSPVKGKRYNVKKIDTTSNKITVNGGGANIDNNTTVVGTLPFQGWVMQFNGTNWYIISRI